MPHKYKLTEATNLAKDINAKVGDFHYSSDGDTKFTVTAVDPNTGAVSWDILNLPSFEQLFKTLDKAISTSRGVYTKVKQDTKFRDIYDEIRKIRNSYRTHLRNEYPDEYNRIKRKGLTELNTPDPTSWADPDDEEKEQMKIITGPLKDLIKKFKLKKEESTSGAAGPYNTPYAFVRKPLKPKSKNKKSKSKYRMKMPSGLVNYMDYSVNENIGAIAGGIAAARKKRREDEEFLQIFDLAKEMGVDVTKYKKYLKEWDIYNKMDWEDDKDEKEARVKNIDRKKIYKDIDENIDLERLGVGYATPKLKRGDEVDYLGRKAKVRSAKYNIYDKSFDYTVDYRDDNNQRTSADGVKDNDLKEWMGINVGGHPRGGTGPGKKVYTTDKESELAKDKLKAIKKRRSEYTEVDEVELTQDFGELDEDHTKRENDQLKKIEKDLKVTSKIHKKQAAIIKKIVKEAAIDMDNEDMSLVNLAKKLGIDLDELKGRIEKMKSTEKDKIEADAFSKSAVAENGDRDLLETSWDYKDELGDIEKRMSNLYREMENDPEIEPEGGPVADQYGDELNKLERRQYALKRWLKWYDTDGGVDNPSPSMMVTFQEGTCGFNIDAKTGKKLNTPGGLKSKLKYKLKESATRSATPGTKNPGATLGPGPAAGPDGVTDNAYIKQFKFQLVPKNKDGTYVQKGSGMIVKKLF